MAKDYHPETDGSVCMGAHGIKKYQSWIGALQWVVTLGRFDVQVSVMTMSSFCVAPRVSHWHAVVHILGYLHRTKDGVIRFRLEMPEEAESLPEPKYDWDQSVYHGIEEDIPTNCPPP